MERIERDRVSDKESDHSIMYGLKLAAKDYRVWVFVSHRCNPWGNFWNQANSSRQSIMLSANHSAYGFNNFYPSIVRGFNLGSNTITLVCTAPPYLVGALITFAMAYNSDRLNERGWHIIISMSVAIAGFIISVATLNVPARYFASFLYIAGCFTGNSLVFAWGASTTSQTPEKRACATAIINVLGQAGNIWSPYFFAAGEEPRYVKAMLLMIAFSVLSIACCGVMKVVLVRANKRIKMTFEGTGRTPQLYTL